jgi:hypothetical protein
VKTHDAYASKSVSASAIECVRRVRERLTLALRRLLRWPVEVRGEGSAVFSGGGAIKLRA